MKNLKILIIVPILLVFGCGSKPIPMEIEDVCNQPIGTNVEVTGYISLPKQITTL